MSKQEVLEGLLEKAIAETGMELTQAAVEVASYALTRSTRLAAGVGQPGFEEAVRAEADAVLLYGGISVTAEADALDQRVLGIVMGAIAMMAAA